MRIIPLTISLVVFTIIGCKDPEYLLDLDRDNASPSNLECSLIDGFSIQIKFHIPDEDFIDSVIILRSFSHLESNNRDTLVFNALGKAQKSSDDSSYIFVDSTSLYEKWNYYSALTFYKGISSLPSDTSLMFFQINAPLCTLQISNFSIQQSIMVEQNYVSGLKIERRSINDTLIESSSVSSSGAYLLEDSISIDTDFPLEHYPLGTVFLYKDIEPNMMYQYTFQSFQEMNGEKRYSASFTDSITYEINIPAITSKAVSDSIVRLYVDIMNWTEYDSFTVWINDDLEWAQKKLGHTDVLLSYNGEFILDINQNTSKVCKIMAYNSNFYSMSNSITISPLAISGFRLIEEGNFWWGCDTLIDQNCREDEGPIQQMDLDDYYMSVYEVTENVYNDASNWPPLMGDIPIDNISFNEAQSFCDEMGNQFPNYIFTLPNEQQWEYAAKYNMNNDVSTIYPWGNEINLYQANYGFQNENAVGVGQYPYPSHFGLYDMAGNVVEWVDNCYSDTLVDLSLSDSCWVLARGGGFWHSADGVRTSSRYNLPRDSKFVGVGFRVVMKPE